MNVIKKLFIGLVFFFSIVNANSSELSIYYSAEGKDIAAWDVYNENVQFLSIRTVFMENGHYAGESQYYTLTRDAGKTWDTLSNWIYYKSSGVKQPELMQVMIMSENKVNILLNYGNLVRYDLNKSSQDTIMLLDSNTKYFEYPVATVNVADENCAILASNTFPTLIYTNNNWDSCVYINSESLYAPVNNALHKNKVSFTSICKSASITYSSVYGYYNRFNLETGIYENGKWKIEKENLPDEVGVPIFIDDSTAFVSGNKVYYESDSIPVKDILSTAVVYKTTNKGKTWSKIFEEYGVGGSLLLQCKDNRLLMPNTNGFFYSDDWGETWINQELDMNTIKYLLSLRFVNKNTAFIRGAEFETVYKYTMDPSSVPEDKVFIPQAKVYPNPAGERVNIEFDETLGVPESVEIYDVLGNKVNGLQVYRSSGSVIVNTGSLSTGTYTARILLGGNVIAKSFVVGR